MNSENDGSARDQRSNQIQGDQGKGLVTPPFISLPKGGGAIRGMGKKFAVNPVTGTGSMTAPIAVSPGRSGFGPQLALSYDSGGGNGPFGFGRSLSQPDITRKTDKGLPQYNDVIDFTDLSIKEGQAKQFVEICQEFPLAIAQVSTKQDDVVFSAMETVSKRIERRYEMRVTANVDTMGIF